MRRLLILGAGGFAREVAWLAQTVVEAGAEIKIAGFADDNPMLQGQILNGFPVVPLDRAKAELIADCFVPAIGSPSTREMLVHRALGEGFEPISLLHPRIEMSRYVSVGLGSIICAGCILTTNITLGSYTQINLDCTIGHDCDLGDYATLAPGVHVSGNVHVRKRTYIGTGANIINGLQRTPLIIDEDAVVGAGACVTKSVPKSITVVGIPARELKK